MLHFFSLDQLAYKTQKIQSLNVTVCKVYCFKNKNIRRIVQGNILLRAGNFDQDKYEQILSCVNVDYPQQFNLKPKEKVIVLTLHCFNFYLIYTAVFLVLTMFLYSLDLITLSTTQTM